MKFYSAYKKKHAIACQWGSVTVRIIWQSECILTDFNQKESL